MVFEQRRTALSGHHRGIGWSTGRWLGRWDGRHEFFGAGYQPVQAILQPQIQRYSTNMGGLGAGLQSLEPGSFGPIGQHPQVPGY